MCAEWYFRSGLDRYVWIYGMICAYFHPHVSRALDYLDGLATMPKYAARTGIVAVCAAVAVPYYHHVFSLPKFQYNVLHPFTSWIPITLWILLRNLLPTMRLKHLRLYGWLGCITLETYISQSHIWMSSEIADGQPKALLALVPGYPLVNFAVVTTMYVFVSFRLFELTNTLKSACLPHDHSKKLLRNIVLLSAWALGAWLVGAGFKQLFALL